MTEPSIGRANGLLTWTALAVAAIAAVAAVAAVVAYAAYSVERALGFTDVFAAAMLAVPLAILAASGYQAYRNAGKIAVGAEPRAALAAARTFLSLGLLPMFIAMVFSLGLGFLDLDRLSTPTVLAVHTAQVSLALSLLVLVVAIVVAWAARVPATQP